MTFTLYPWQKKPWQQFLAYRLQKRLPHALMLLGAEGLGKKQFALSVAFSILCSSNSFGIPCGTCSDCCLFNAQSHPDLILIEPEKNGQAIKIDQIRELNYRVSETSLKGGFKVIILNPATAMNRNAANAFLKTLEEPSPNTLIILVSDQRSTLPPTIISRCQKIYFPKPTEDEALAWLGTSSSDIKLLLSLSQGAPLKVKEMEETGFLALRKKFYDGLDLLAQRKANPLVFAANWQDQELSLIVNLLSTWMRDLICSKLSDNSVNLINMDYQTNFKKYPITVERGIRYLTTLQKIGSYSVSGFNLNKQLVLEDLLINWMSYAAG